ncbi:MAG: acyl-CoA synthetase [Rhizobacter sp.]|nr:acyl-CoA synthetase [Rhizobacter sp.]
MALNTTPSISEPTMTPTVNSSPTPRAAPRVSVGQLLEPRSIAVVGASESRAKFGGRIMYHLVKHGFTGELMPINRGASHILGHKAYASISDVPHAPDVAILAVPGNTLVQNVAAAADAGVGCCVVISTGFAEAGDEGAAMQQELVDIGARSGMRIVGPNCMGFIVPHHHMALCSSIVLDTDSLAAGPISMISQSGGLMVSMFDRAATDGIGFRHCVSLGNQADLEICDFLEFMVTDPGTRAICLYVEGLKDGPRFRAAALACRNAGKALFMLKTGRTEAGVKAARSHTASLAGSYEVLDAVCREVGVVLASDPDDMVRAAHVLARSAPQRAAGDVGVFSGSGGGASLASDRVTEVGLKMAELSLQTRAKLGEMLLPPQADNPIDLGGRKTPDSFEISKIAADVLLADPAVAYGLVVLTSMPFFAEKTALIGQAVKDSGKPCFIALTPGRAADPVRDTLRAMDLPYFDRLEDALRAMELVARHDRLLADAQPAPERPAGLSAQDAQSICAALPSGAVTEQEVKTALGGYGIRTSREQAAATPAAAAQAAAAIGFPVVLKIVSRDIAHKSDVGGVALHLKDAQAVEAAASAMLALVAERAPLAVIDGFIVQEMLKGEAELIVGTRFDPLFGPVLLVGFGGTLVEVLRDVAIAPAPIGLPRARQMLASLRLAPLLHGVRGKPALDVQALCEAMVRVSWLAHDLGDRLIELEVNPFMVNAQGGGVAAADGRATLDAAS